MKHIKLEPIIAPTMSAAISSQDQLLPSAHSSPYSLPTPIASAQATPANHTGASRCSISSSQDVTTSDTHTKRAIPADANAAAVAQTNRCLVLSFIVCLPPCSRYQLAFSAHCAQREMPYIWQSFPLWWLHCRYQDLHH